MKKIISYLIMVMFIFQLTAFAQSDELDNVLNDTANYIMDTLKNPEVSSIGGEWAVIGLARAGIDNKTYYQDYYKRVEEYVKKNSGSLSDNKYTEYARLILSVGAIGKDPSDVGGVNLIKPLDDYDAVTRQGINGPVWALIAVNSKSYGSVSSAVREQYIQYIIDAQLSDGGWSFDRNAEVSDPDITASAVIALSQYKNNMGAVEAVDKAVDYLSESQNERGGFSSWGSESPESGAQVLMAICELGIPVDDSRFVKNDNTLLDNLMGYYSQGKGFSHTRGGESNQMTTEQCMCALAAVKRNQENQNTFYDMTDIGTIADEPKDTFGLPNKNADISYKNVIEVKTFTDISGHKNQSEIEALASRGIISGMTDTEFKPDATMTRAEFATITVNALGLPLKRDNPFNDVKEKDWFHDYVSTAYAYGIVRGVSDTEFNPNGTITREEAMAMVMRLSGIAGMTAEINENEARSVLAVFDDYKTVSDWAVTSAAYCIKEGISDSSEMTVKPKEYVLRAEIAQMLFRMMERAELII